MNDICSICKKRKTTREGHIDPLCECENNKLVEHYKSDEVQEFMNAPLGDPNLTEAERGQMGTQVMPQTFSELIEEYGFIKENIIYYLPYHNSSNCEGRLVIHLLNDNETIRISTTIENGWEATDLFETKNIEDIIYLIKRLTA